MTLTLTDTNIIECCNVSTKNNPTNIQYFKLCAYKGLSNNNSLEKKIYWNYMRCSFTLIYANV
jgi:hypothetical protein